jgi:hypothetical protein
MAKPNYSFQKRQRELAKKQKKEAKLKEKELAKAGTAGAQSPDQGPEAEAPPNEPAPPDKAA